MWKVWSTFSVEILFFDLSSCSLVLPPLPLLLNLVDVQCASIISKKKVSNFYNFPGKYQPFLQLPIRWTPFWQQQRETCAAEPWKRAQSESASTRNPRNILLCYFGFPMTILKLQIFESSSNTHTKNTKCPLLNVTQQLLIAIHHQMYEKTIITWAQRNL